MSRDGLPDPISRLIDELSKLPGIGEKNATRLAFHIFRSSDGFTKNLSEAILKTKSNVIICSVCQNFTEQNPCKLCDNHNRDSSIICVVEEPQDLLAIEKSGEFKGKYHVLYGAISPLDGIGPEELKIKELMGRLSKNKIEEVIIATNTNVEGEATSMYLAKIIKSYHNIKTTRIAHGIPMGGDIEYTDELTLGRAIKERREI